MLISGAALVVMNMTVIKGCFTGKRVIMSSAGQRNGRTGPAVEVMNMTVVKRGGTFVVMYVALACALIRSRSLAAHPMSVAIIYGRPCRIRMDMARYINKTDEFDGMVMLFPVFLSQWISLPLPRCFST